MRQFRDQMFALYLLKANICILCMKSYPGSVSDEKWYLDKTEVTQKCFQTEKNISQVNQNIWCGKRFTYIPLTDFHLSLNKKLLCCWRRNSKREKILVQQPFIYLGIIYLGRTGTRGNFGNGLYVLLSHVSSKGLIFRLLPTSVVSSDGSRRVHSLRLFSCRDPECQSSLHLRRGPMQLQRQRRRQEMRQMQIRILRSRSRFDTRLFAL